MLLIYCTRNYSSQPVEGVLLDEGDSVQIGFCISYSHRDISSTNNGLIGYAEPKGDPTSNGR